MVVYENTMHACRQLTRRRFCRATFKVFGLAVFGFLVPLESIVSEKPGETGLSVASPSYLVINGWVLRSGDLTG